MKGGQISALGVWHARDVRSRADRVYRVYLGAMVLLVIVAPVVYATWMAITGANAVAALTSDAAPSVAMIVVASMWIAALLVGRERGPALRPPFLADALVSSSLAWSTAFRGPMLRAGSAVTTATAIMAGLIGLSLATAGITDVVGVASLTIAGAMVGIITTIAWLAGQVFPRAGALVALGIAALSTVSAALPPLQQFTPWGWVALSYPGVAQTPDVTMLGLVAAALIGGTPLLLNRLDRAVLVEQAVRWDAAVSHATTADFGTAATIYQRHPRRGRHIGAVRPTRSLTVTVVIRSAVGAVRTQGRLISGIAAVAIAGVLATLAFTSDLPAWVVGAAAGVFLFGGLGPLMDGVRHAASVAGDVVLYGVSDEFLVAAHLLFPITAVALVLVAAVAVCSIVVGSGVGVPLASCLALAVICVIARVGDAVKGPMSPALLAPIPTPMGDLGALVRLTWTLDAVLLAGVGGAAAAMIVASPLPILGVGGLAVVLALRRWRHRR